MPSTREGNAQPAQKPKSCNRLRACFARCAYTRSEHLSQSKAIDVGNSQRNPYITG